ncbi:MFS transporter [Lactobacillus sp. ESL0681]|uniref:MFS transporter n=1 Tax=Lactobacillus sp. ESL0681 TaxID=2983211 RepID=UPI0023F88B13|nr:MFS transporter [Lactobacillus sp. ESL0681]WEV40117.1 MFS transporter [Lactobacillus sp. ESL0681]
MNSKKPSLMKVSILLVSIITASAPAINGNIPVLAKAFPNVPLTAIEFLTTVPSLFLIVGILISNPLANKIGLKSTVIIGVSLTAIAGLAPVAVNNFTVLLLTRALFGLGVGLFNSLLVTIISYFYTGNERSTTLGWQSTFEGLGGVLVTFIAGQLVKINWHMSFLAYAITLPALILFTLYVPRIPRITEPKVVHSTSKTNFGTLIPYLLLTFIVISLYMIMRIKVSSLIVTAGYGSATDASYVILALSLGAMLGGGIFGRVFAKINNWIVPLAMAIMALAMGMIAVAQTTILTIMGGFLTGFGVRLFFPWILNEVNRSQSGNTLTTSIILISYNLAGTLAPYSALLIQKLVGFKSLTGFFYFNLVCYLILAVCLAIAFARQNKIGQQ